MFEFLFRRGKSAAKKAEAAAASDAAPRPGKQTSPTPAANAAAGAAEAARQREAILIQADAAARDETAAIAFVLSSAVPEARLRAADGIRSAAGLEQVRRAVRETDRRVARLMQQRLEQLAREQASARQAEAALQEARRLAEQPVLRANQVVAMEAAWQAVGAVPEPVQQEYARLHAALGRRLQAQAGLQRQVLDAIAAVRTALAVPDDAADIPVTTATAPAHPPTAPEGGEQAAEGSANGEIDGVPSHLARAAQRADQQLDSITADPELPALPKQLMPELLQLRSQLQVRIDAALALAQQRASAAAAARERAQSQGQQVATGMEPAGGAPTLQHLSAATPATPATAASETATTATTATALAATAADESAALSAATTAPTAAPARAPKLTALEIAARREAQAAALAALQAALEEGALLKAMEQDRLLRLYDGDGPALAPAQKSALQAARAELGRLQGWARWGGAVSRDELLASVEALPQQALPIAELAKKVGSMRERWRSLDASAGAAPRTLWLRFDAACTAAHAPVAAHLAALHAQRTANAGRAQALLAEIDAFRAEQGIDETTAAGAERDWRSLAAFCQRMRHAWQRLGPLERREQKRLDAAFGAAMQPLLVLLDARQARELAARERLIAEVAALAPQARDTPERLQELQARWQQQARAVPLPRTQEQAAWVQFRAACDAVFAARKQAGAAADVQRGAALAQKQALCDELEALAISDDAQVADKPGRARAMRAAWDAAGPVPRAAHDALQARYAAAMAAIDRQVEEVGRNAAARERDAILAGLMLCLDTEQQAVRLAGGAPGEASGAGAVSAPADAHRSTGSGAGAGSGSGSSSDSGSDTSSDTSSNPDSNLSSDSDSRAGAVPSSTTVAAAREAWQHLPRLPKNIERLLRPRFEAACDAITANDAQYARRLAAGQAGRDALLLRLEVACGIASPPHLMRERMAQQVAGLQSAFKGTDERATTPQSLFADLLSLPALADTEARRRMAAIVAAAEPL